MNAKLRATERGFLKFLSRTGIIYLKSLDNGAKRTFMCTPGQKTGHLVVLAKEGDQSALNQLYSVYAERVRWMVRFRMDKELRSKFESMDLVQDTLIHALSGLHNFTYKNESEFIRWLSKIAENELRSKLRKLHADKRDVHKEVRFDNGGTKSEGRYVGIHEPIQTTTPSMILSRKEDLVKLEKAIDELKPEYRESIILTKVEGLSYQEIGQKLGKSSDAVRMLATRAMAELTTIYRKVS
jgi:RNA polymerase sigma-70 factor (ECF subfamily)